MPTAQELYEQRVDPSLGSYLAGATASGFGMLGNLLDLPGSMVRDVVTLRNPFDQLLDPLSHSETGASISGRQVLEQYGLATPNKETGIAGWWEDPAEMGRDLYGFAAEMALDPLSWLTGGLAAAARKGTTTGAAKAAKVAGAAAKPGRIKRAFGIAGDVADALDPGFHLGKAVGGSQVGADIVQHIKRSPAAAAGLKTAVLGKYNEQVDEMIDRVWRVGRQHLDPAVEGQRDPLLQELNSGRRAEFDKRIVPEVTSKAQNLLGVIRQLEIPDDRIEPLQKLISRAIEGNDYSILPRELHQPVQEMVETERALHGRMEALGANVKWLEDNIPAYSPRQAAHNIEKLISDMRIKDTRAGKSAVGMGKREHIFREGKTQDWNELTADEDIHKALASENYQPIAAQLMREKYGDRIDWQLPIEQEGMWKAYDPETGAEMWLEPRRNQPHIRWDRGSFDDPIRVEMVEYKDKDGNILERPMRPGETYPEVAERGEQLRTYHLATKDRFEEVAEWMHDIGDSKELIDNGGMFSDDIISIYTKRSANKLKFAAELKEMPSMLEKAVEQGLFREGRIAPSPEGVAALSRGKTVKEMFNQGYFQGLNKKTILRRMAEDSEVPAIKDLVDEMTRYDEFTEREWVDWDEFAKAMDTWRMDPELYDKLEANMVLHTPGEIGNLTRAFNYATTVFKMGVLTHPARIGRDYTSAQIQNMLDERWSLGATLDAKRIATNEVATGLHEMPEVQQWIMEYNLPGLQVDVGPNGIKQVTGIADKQQAMESATEAMKRKYAGARTDTATIARNQPGVDSTVQNVENFRELEEARPGAQQKAVGLLGHWNEQLDRLLFRTDEGLTWNPTHITGIRETLPSGEKIMRKNSKFFLAAMSESAQKLSDDMGRLTGIIAGMKKGESFDEAFRATTRAQINYSPSNLTPTLRRAKSVFPFLTFDNGMVRYLIRQLATKPTGLHGKAIRGQHRGEDKTAPEYIRRQAGMRLYDAEDGTSHYMTMGGLMHAGVIDKLGDGTTAGFLRGILGSTSPYVKAPFEWASGHSLFMDKKLTDLDPPMGRIVRNIKSHVGMDVPEGKAKPLASSHLLEFLVSNSPASRIVGTVKKLTDTRRPFLLDAAEQLTGGGRWNTVSPWMRERERAGQLERIARKLGVTEFSMTNVRQKDIDNAEDPETKEVLGAIKRYQSEQRRIKRKQKQAD